MASVLPGIRTLFVAEATINSLLDTTTSIWRDAITQGHDMPYISLSMLNEDPLGTLDGTTGLRAANIDIDCVAASRLTADAIADAVETYFHDYTGAAGDSTIHAVVPDTQGRVDDEFPVGQGSDVYKYVTTLNMTVQYV